MNMTDEHPHRRKILGAISAGVLAVFGGCYLISTDNDSDEDVADDREGNETGGNDTNETAPDPPQDPNETDLTTNPDLNDSDDC